MIVLICFLTLFICLFFVRLELRKALANRPYSLFSIIIFISISFYYLLPLILFSLNPDGPWKFLGFVRDKLQNLDLILASISILIVTILLGFVRFCVKPLNFKFIFNFSSSAKKSSSIIFKYALYSVCIASALLFIYSVYSGGGLIGFLSLGKFLKSASSNLSYGALLARYFLPLVYYVLITLTVWFTRFYSTNLYLLPLSLLLGSILAFSSGSRGQIIGFLMTNLYVYAIYMLTTANNRLGELLLPFRVQSRNNFIRIYLSKRKILILSSLVLLFFSFVFVIQYLKFFIWSLASIADGNSLTQIIVSTIDRHSLATAQKSQMLGLSNALVAFYSIQDHALASFLVFYSNIKPSIVATHQFDLLYALKNLVVIGDNISNTPSLYFQSYFQKFTAYPIGRVPPNFLAASIYYHTIYLWIPLMTALYYFFSSFDNYISRFRLINVHHTSKLFPFRAYIFVWTCICPIAMFNYLFFPDWFMAIYKILPFLVFSVPVLPILGKTTFNFNSIS